MEKYAILLKGDEIAAIELGTFAANKGIDKLIKLGFVEQDVEINAENEKQAIDNFMNDVTIAESESIQDNITAPILLTTETNLVDMDVIERYGVVYADCVYGVNVVKDIFVGFRDVFGGRSKSIEDIIRNGRTAVTDELKHQAFRKGANAVIGISYSVNDISGKNVNMICVSATGTAVAIKL
ncbi:heavy metal-binding domain-containing protein [Vibrio hibernica]|uniref:heavy metal-binding domain-containing protein n=1 Tax=Vibrio hibernica TaxID=2587465 RepID=UPI00188035A3|nr:heavy metal-binding domain-containing protein [Vibrio hibernica]